MWDVAAAIWNVMARNAVDPDCDEAQHRAPDAIWISTKTEKNLGELMRRMLDAMERR